MQYEVKPGNMKVGRRTKQATSPPRPPKPPEPFTTHAPRLLDKILRDINKGKVESVLLKCYGVTETVYKELDRDIVDMLKTLIERNMITSFVLTVQFKGPPAVAKLYDLK